MVLGPIVVCRGIKCNQAVEYGSMSLMSLISLVRDWR